MKKFEKTLLGNQSGFTLIEIIAVLIILGILAAVAVPKFMNLTDEASQKALDGAVAAGFSNATMSYSQYVLKNGEAPTGITGSQWTGGGASVTIETDLGDFTITSLTYTSGTPNTVSLNVLKKGTSDSTSDTFNLP